MSYHRFKSESGEEYGSFEVFYDDGATPRLMDPESNSETSLDAGWYWWACFPGCLPDGDPSGPFATEQEAIDNAQENA
jgi:hypothetical protein